MAKKFLIIRMSSIGDILLTTPLIRVLKKKYPDCRIDFVVKKQFEELVLHHPALSTIYVYDKRAGKGTLKGLKDRIRATQYDIIIDIHKNFRSLYLRSGSGAKKIAVHRKYAFIRWLLVNLKINLYRDIPPVYQRYINSLSSLDLKYDGAGLEFFISDAAKEKMSRLWGETDRQTIVGIAPGASYYTKRWMTDGYAEVINHLISRSNTIVLLFGDKSDRVVAQKLIAACGKDKIFDFTGKLSLSETAALMEKCHLMLTNDSGLMHLAVALKKKVVTIFGSTTEELGFFPYSENSMVIQNKDLRCRPCSHVGRNRCPKEHFECMKKISPDKVLHGINKLI